MPGTDRDAVIKACQKLAAYGVPAEPVLATLAADASLPEPHRAMSGIFFARFHRFDPKTLRLNLGAENPFLVIESVQLLSRIGGADEKMAAGEAAAKRPGLAGQIQKFVNAWPPDLSLPPRILVQMNKILLDPDRKVREMAVTALTVDEGNSMQPAFEEILGSGVLDQSFQMFVAASIFSWHKDDVEALKGLCARKKPRYVRFLAIQKLAKKGEAEREFLRQLGADPTEPLRENIKQFLAGK